MTETTRTTAQTTTAQWYDKTGLVIFLCIFLFPIGLYALWKSPKYSKGWKVFGTAFIGVLVIMVATDKKTQIKAATSPATAAATPADNKPDPEEKPAPEEKSGSTNTDDNTDKTGKYLFETADEFKDAFNKYSASKSLDLTIDDLTIKEGEVQNTFQYMFTDNLGILGTVRKSDGKMTELMMIGSGDGSFKSGSNIIICMMAIIATVDPDLAPEKRIDVLKGLGMMGDKKVDITNMDGKTETEKMKYSIASNKYTGLMFSVSRK